MNHSLMIPRRWILETKQVSYHGLLSRISSIYYRTVKSLEPGNVHDRNQFSYRIVKSPRTGKCPRNRYIDNSRSGPVRRDDEGVLQGRTRCRHRAGRGTGEDHRGRVEVIDGSEEFPALRNSRP